MNEYGHYFRQLHSATRQKLTNALEAMELTSAQGSIMGYLAHCNTPPCAKDLEDAFHLSHPTVSGLLSRLEKKEFIRLEPDAQDKRVKRIVVAPKGIAMHQAMHDTIVSTEKQIVQDFTPEEMEEFTRLLRKAAKNLGIDTPNRANSNCKEET